MEELLDLVRTLKSRGYKELDRAALLFLEREGISLDTHTSTTVEDLSRGLPEISLLLDDRFTLD